MTRWIDLPFAVIDTETTGLSIDESIPVDQRSRIVEMAVVKFESARTGKYIDRRSTLLNPSMPIPAEASNIHGILDGHVALKPIFAQVVEGLYAYLAANDCAMLVAYNAPFDYAMLRNELERANRSDVNANIAHHFTRHFNSSSQSSSSSPGSAGSPSIWPFSCYYWIDPLVWVWKLDKWKKGKKLTDACARRQLTWPADAQGGALSHRASTDAYMTGVLLSSIARYLPSDLAELIEVQAQLRDTQQRDRDAWRAKQNANG